MLEAWAGNLEASLTNRIQEVGERIQEDKIEETDTSDKKPVKSKRNPGTKHFGKDQI